MKILYLAWNFPPATGGMEYTSGQLFDRLRKRGFTLTAIARHDPARGSESGVYRPSRPGLLFYQLYSLLMGWRLMKREACDVILCPGITNGPVAWCLSRWFRKPYLMLAHGSDILHEGRLYRRVMQFLFRHAHGVAANTAMTRGLLEREGVTPSRIRVIYPAVDASRFPACTDRLAPKARQQLAGRKVLLTVGRLIRRKGVLDFVEQVLPALSRSCPEVMHVVVGGDAKQSLIHHERLFDLIARRVRELRLEEHVRLLGEIDDATLHDLYYAADIFVLPVRALPGDVEGFGLVFMEAGLAGLPVVSTRVGGIPEAVADGRTGVLLESDDWKGMTETLDRLLKEPAARDALGVAGRARAQAEFDWPAIEQQYADFIEQVASRSGDRHAGD